MVFELMRICFHYKYVPFLFETLLLFKKTIFALERDHNLSSDSSLFLKRQKLIFTGSFSWTLLLPGFILLLTVDRNTDDEWFLSMLDARELYVLV